MLALNQSQSSVVQGTGIGLVLTAALRLARIESWWINAGVLVLHESVFIGYIDPLLEVLVYVAVSHVLGYYAVLLAVHQFGSETLLPCVALGATLLVFGTILAVLCRQQQPSVKRASSPPIPLEVPLRTECVPKRRKPAQDTNDISDFL